MAIPADRLTTHREVHGMADTLIRIFLSTITRHEKPVQFMRKAAGRWESISAQRALAEVESLGLALRALGVSPGDRVALLSETRYEWALCDLAILGIGAVTVPIYSTLTGPQVEYVLANSESKLAIVSSQAQYQKIAEARPRLARLGHVVRIDRIGAAATGPSEHFLDDLLAEGKAHRQGDSAAFRSLADQVKPDDLATIIYTSGTTGDPKGAMLTHGNIASNVDACLKVVSLGSNDVALSFLPLCHVFERMAGLYAMLAAGATIAYAESLETVAQNAAEVRPTVLTGVPRFYEKVHARVLESRLSLPPQRRKLFEWGLGVLTDAARRRFEGGSVGPVQRVQCLVADRLIAAKIRERFGGRLKLCISGGAPLGPNVMEFFFAIGITVLEGYGLTETSPVICLNPPGREKPGTVGPPIPGVEVRIGDEGEILTRGPHIMRGYYRNEEATKTALRDGWFHTGDVGLLDPEGYLVITDRLKDLLVTAGGKKVAPQPIEARLKTSRWIGEAVLLGDQRPYVVCLIAPNFAHLEEEAKSRGWPFESRRELIEHPEARALYQAEIDAVNRDLAPFEQIKQFALLERELTVEAGELTPTLKVKRRVMMERYAEPIATLYAGHAPADAARRAS